MDTYKWKQCALRLGGVLYTGDRLAEWQFSESVGIYRDLLDFLREWFSDSPTLTVFTSGSTGQPKPMMVSKHKMMNSARITCDFLGLQRGDRALLCMPLKYIAGKMMVVRALVAELDLVVREPSGHPLADVTEELAFAAMVPLQVYNSLGVPLERDRLSAVERLIIGGGAIDAEMESRLRPMPNRIYSTYGMTETLSHIALRRLSGSEASSWYLPFPSVHLSLSEEGTLLIDAPLVCEETLRTHDVVELRADGRFRILGRLDNIINSGGVKIQTERVEMCLRSIISTTFALTSVPDPKFGEAIVLLVERDPLLDVEQLRVRLHGVLPRFEQPKHILMVDKIPLTETGKIARAECRKLAKRYI